MVPTLQDVAKLANISIMTVSRAINHSESVSPATRKKVRKIIEELDYRPHRMAVGLRTKRSRVIGMVISDISNPFFAAIARGIQDACKKSGYNVLLCNTDGRPENEDEYIGILKEYYVDGVILCSVRRRIGEELLKSFKGVVFINRKPENIRGDAVLNDNFKGSYMAIQYLVEKGHRKIAIINDSQVYSTGRERFRGVMRAFKDFRIKPPKKYLKFTNSSTVGGYKAAHEILNLEKLPSAIFSCNNFTTLGLIRAIKQHQVKIPSDISVIGFDETDWSEINDPPLTTVKQPTYEMGKVAAELLISRLTSPKPPGNYIEKRLEPALIERASVKFLN